MRQDVELENQMIVSSRNNIIREIETSSTNHIQTELMMIQDKYINMKTEYLELEERFVQMEISYQQIQSEHSLLSDAQKRLVNENQSLKMDNYQIKANLLDIKKSATMLSGHHKGSNNYSIGAVLCGVAWCFYLFIDSFLYVWCVYHVYVQCTVMTHGLLSYNCDLCAHVSLIADVYSSFVFVYVYLTCIFMCLCQQVPVVSEEEEASACRPLTRSRWWPLQKVRFK